MNTYIRFLLSLLIISPATHMSFLKAYAGPIVPSKKSKYIYSTSYYSKGQRMGEHLITCYTLLAHGDHKKSKEEKEQAFKKHSTTLTTIKDNLALPWFYWGSNPLKTHDQKQAFVDARNYFKGIGDALESFEFDEYLKELKVEKKRAQELLEAYNFMAQNSLQLSALETVEEAYKKWQQFNKELADLTKKLWS